jgi:DNA adenine methylase
MKALVPGRFTTAATRQEVGRLPSSVVTDSADALKRLLGHRALLSPLRYPGGKRRLVPYVASALIANDLRPGLFVEPYAGGASVSLELLHAKLVDRIGISDSDPMVAAFWETVFEDADWLCKQIETIPIDLQNWCRMKRGRYTARRSLALACLFLNRTSFNGSLNHRAGPIGGQKQESDYSLDCRFPREKLISRVRACEALASRVDFVKCDEAGRAMAYARKRARAKEWTTFFYLDPPFWAKSDRLYRLSFQKWQHEELAESLLWFHDSWLLSYDPAPEVEELYGEHRDVRSATIELFYTGTRRSAGQELVITNLKQLPEETRLWRTESERAADRETAVQ